MSVSAPQLRPILAEIQPLKNATITPLDPTDVFRTVQGDPGFQADQSASDASGEASAGKPAPKHSAPASLLAQPPPSSDQAGQAAAPDTDGQPQPASAAPSLQKIRFLRGLNPQIEAPAFAKQLKEALEAAGIDGSHPIKITEGAVDEYGRRKPVVDPSTPNAAQIQALIDNSKPLTEGYHLAQSSLHIAEKGKVIDAFSRANRCRAGPGRGALRAIRRQDCGHRTVLSPSGSRQDLPGRGDHQPARREVEPQTPGPEHRRADLAGAPGPAALIRPPGTFSARSPAKDRRPQPRPQHPVGIELLAAWRRRGRRPAGRSGARPCQRR